MKNKKGSILIILLLLLAGAGLVFVGYKYISKQNAQKTITPAPYPLETIDPTANWKTYSNDQYNFSFKYPNKLEAQKVTGKDIFVARDPNFSGGTGSLVPLSLAVTIGNNSEKSPSFSWIDELIDTKTLTVSGVSFKEKIYKGDAAEGSIAYTLIASTQKDARGYFFEFSFYTDGCLSPDKEMAICKSENEKFIDDNYKTIDQILSTFKFLDQKSTPCEQNGGTWDKKYKECGGITKEVCGKIGGEWVECGSPCRHEPNAQLCIQSCVLYCQL